MIVATARLGRPRILAQLDEYEVSKCEYRKRTAVPLESSRLLSESLCQAPTRMHPTLTVNISYKTYVARTLRTYLSVIVSVFCQLPLCTPFHDCRFEVIIGREFDLVAGGSDKESSKCSASGQSQARRD